MKIKKKRRQRDEGEKQKKRRIDQVMMKTSNDEKRTRVKEGMGEDNDDGEVAIQ